MASKAADSDWEKVKAEAIAANDVARNRLRLAMKLAAEKKAAEKDQS